MKDSQLVWYYEGKVCEVIHCNWNGLDQHWFVQLVPEYGRGDMFVSDTNESMTYGEMKERYPEYLI